MLFLSISVFAFSQTGNIAVGGTGAKRSVVSLSDKQIDSLINLPPHPDSAIITLNQMNAIVAKIRKEWNMESGEPAMQALQLVVNAALIEYRKKRAEQYKGKN